MITFRPKRRTFPDRLLLLCQPVNNRTGEKTKRLSYFTHCDHWSAHNVPLLFHGGIGFGLFFILDIFGKFTAQSNLWAVHHLNLGRFVLCCNLQRFTTFCILHICINTNLHMIWKKRFEYVVSLTSFCPGNNYRLFTCS